MAVDDGGCEVDALAVVDARVLAQHLEGAHSVDGVALHQDALGGFDERAASERAFEVVILGEAAQDGVDRALPVLDVSVADVGEDASLGCLLDEVWIAGMDERVTGQAASWTILSIRPSA